MEAFLGAFRHSGSRLTRYGGEYREAHSLTALSVEILRSQPTLESSLYHRPFAIEDRKPRRITVPALMDIGLTPDALEGEAKPSCRCPRFGIERIALPSVATVAKFIEGVPHHQVHRLGRSDPTLKSWRVNDPANLDATSVRVDIQIARLAERFTAREIDQCIFRAHAAGTDGIDSRAQFLWPRSPRQVRPEVALAIRSVGGVQRLAVPDAIDWLNSAESSAYRIKGRELSG